MKAEGVHRQLRQLFRRHGLPDAIRSDHGAPFASHGIHGLNRLNAWWLQLGIVHQRITPASPPENGAHERMHRVLKAQAAKPAAPNANLQQRVFNAFVQTYNEVRPHEALNDDTPASRWHPSTRPFPTRVTPPSYPGHFEVRRVSSAGTFRLHNGQQFLSQAFNDEMIGLEEIDDGIWNVLYYQTLLGRFDERTRTIPGAPSLKKDCSPCPRTKCHLCSRLFTSRRSRAGHACLPRQCADRFMYTVAGMNALTVSLRVAVGAHRCPADYFARRRCASTSCGSGGTKGARVGASTGAPTIAACN